MPADDRLKLARDCYGAYESGDRRIVEERLTDDFTFNSPADVGIDRATYFERCWPNSELIEAFEFKRLIEAGDEVVVTYESTRHRIGLPFPKFARALDVRKAKGEDPGRQRHRGEYRIGLAAHALQSHSS